MSFRVRIKQIIKGINAHPLARKHKFLAYRKLLRWQLGQYLFPGIKTLEFLPGVHFLAEKGITGITGNIYCGLHEFNDMGFLLHFLRAEDLFIDVGANVGSYTLLASGIVGAKSISSEFAPVTFQKLKANIISNHLEVKSSLINAAVGCKNGILHFTSDLDTVNHVLLDENLITAQTISVPVHTLDAFVEVKCVKNCLIKIDVEGFEFEVLGGMKKILEEGLLKAIIIELNGSGARYGYDEKEIKKQITEAGFRAYHYDPFGRSLTAMEIEGNFNTIYLRDLPFVEMRIHSANKISVFGESF